MNKKRVNKLALGTVQFGLDYGVANNKGQVQKESVKDILNIAKKNGITDLDTAITYGNSEQVLGEIGVDWAEIITKLPALPAEIDNVKSWVKEQVTASLKRLKVPFLKGLLLHNVNDLSSSKGNDLFEALEWVKSKGLVQKIGYSIYCPDDLERNFTQFRPDLIQSPFNIMDQRLEQSGWMERLKQQGVEIHVRSVFLQGLLLMEPEKRPNYFTSWHSKFKAFDSWLEKQKITAHQATFGFVNSIDFIDKIVVGVDSPNNLVDLLKISEFQIDKIPAFIASNDENLINPVTWTKNDEPKN